MAAVGVQEAEVAAFVGLSCLIEIELAVAAGEFCFGGFPCGLPRRQFLVTDRFRSLAIWFLGIWFLAVWLLGILGG